MKKLLLAIVLLLALAMVGCNPEKQRYRVEVVEIIVGDDAGEVGYIVSKYGYSIGGIFLLETEAEYQIGDILYVVQIDKYTVMPFAEWVEDR